MLAYMAQFLRRKGYNIDNGPSSLEKDKELVKWLE
jgi:hypothetical protein